MKKYPVTFIDADEKVEDYKLELPLFEIPEAGIIKLSGRGPYRVVAATRHFTVHGLSRIEVTYSRKTLMELLREADLLEPDPA